MLFCKKNINTVNTTTSIDLKTVKKKLSEAVAIAKGYRDIETFIKDMKMVDARQLVGLLKGTYSELPDRNLLRKIANHSQGRINFIYLYEICGYKTSDPEEDRSWKSWIPKKGDIVYGNLGYVEDSIQGGQRPILIVGNDLGLKYSDVVFGIPISSKRKGNNKMHVHIGTEYNLVRDSFCLCEQTRVLSKRVFFFNGDPWKICTLDEQKLQEVYHVLECQLGIKNLNFDTNKAFELIKQIKLLKKNIKVKESRDLIQLFNEKVNEFKNYCKNYNINHKDIIKEYNNVNNYGVQVI